MKLSTKNVAFISKHDLMSYYQENQTLKGEKTSREIGTWLVPPFPLLQARETYRKGDGCYIIVSNRSLSRLMNIIQQCVGVEKISEFKTSKSNPLPFLIKCPES